MTKNIQIYKTWCTPVYAQLPFINPRSTWKRAQVDQPRILPSTPTLNHKQSMQNFLSLITADSLIISALYQL